MKLSSLVFLLLIAFPSSGADPQKPKLDPMVLFMSDYGVNDDSVAICKGTMLGADPRLRIIDITHNVRKHSVVDGARLLVSTSMYFGPGAVFAVVVEPGIAGKYKNIAVKTKAGQFFILPDNGLVSLVEERDGIEEAREITNSDWVTNAQNSLFPGRDVLCPAAAHLASGKSFAKAGPLLKQHKQLNIPNVKITDRSVIGLVLGVDGGFGNLVTNIMGLEFEKLGYEPGDKVKFIVGDKSFIAPYVKNLTEAPKKTELLFSNATGAICAAVNHGNFAEKHDIKAPVKIEILGKGKWIENTPLGTSQPRAPASKK